MDLLRSAYGSDDSDGEVHAHACRLHHCITASQPAPSHPNPPHHHHHHHQPHAVAAVAPASPSKRKRGKGKNDAAASPAPAPAPAAPVQLVSRTVNSAPFVNPALKTVMNRPGFIPPTQKQLTTNVKVGGRSLYFSGS